MTRNDPLPENTQARMDAIEAMILKGLDPDDALTLIKIDAKFFENFSCTVCGAKDRRRRKRVGGTRGEGGAKKVYCADCAYKRKLESNARERKDWRTILRNHRRANGWVCLHCKQPFLCKRKDAKYCSGKCRVAASRAASRASLS